MDALTKWSVTAVQTVRESHGDAAVAAKCGYGRGQGDLRNGRQRARSSSMSARYSSTSDLRDSGALTGTLDYYLKHADKTLWRRRPGNDQLTQHNPDAVRRETARCA
jgi:hypothetical protein